MKSSTQKKQYFKLYHLLKVSVAWIIIPCILALIGFLYGIVNYPGASFFSLNFYHQKNVGENEYVTLPNPGTVQFSFTSQMNNLGTIALRFKLPKEDPEGIITFKLMNQDTGELLFTGNYDMRVLYGGNFYPLGFPTIIESKNIRYTVTLESVYTKGEGIQIHFDNVAFLTKYRVDKIHPLKDFETFMKYFKIKVENLSQDVEFYSYILLYLLPTLLYLIWKIMNNRYVTATLIVFIAYRIYSSVYVPLQEMGYEAELYFKLATLFFVIVKFNIGGSAYFIVGLAMYMLSTVYVALNKIDIAEGYAVWTYYFIALALCAYIWEYNGSSIRARLSKIVSPLRKIVRKLGQS